MDANDLLAILSDAASSPAMLLIGFLLTFIGGVMCGALGARAWREPLPSDEAGDTHAQLLTLPPHEPLHRRVRAGAPPLPYSYDGRRAATRPPQPDHPHMPR